eukprot:scaffold27501_cov14-Prasinocladus_malaysianus.AAC.1
MAPFVLSGLHTDSEVTVFSPSLITVTKGRLMERHSGTQSVSTTIMSDERWPRLRAEDALAPINLSFRSRASGAPWLGSRQVAAPGHTGTAKYSFQFR